MTVDIERVRRVFENDRFATGNGVRILEAAPGHARCELVITDEHRNGMNAVMGGAIYTLADLAFAVASNVGQLATVTLDSSMTFLNGVKGETLYAEAVCEKAGSRTCCFNITVTDNLGTQVAVCRSTGMRVGKHSLVPVPRYQLAAFDLDGTILSTIEDLAAAVNHALLEAGLPPRCRASSETDSASSSSGAFRKARPKQSARRSACRSVPTTRSTAWMRRILTTGSRRCSGT